MGDSTEHVISMLRACVVSTKNDISLKMLRLDYSKLVGSEIPYRSLGYGTLEAFIESIPDLKMNKGPEGYVTISAAPTERSQHIADLVARQNSPKRKVFQKYIPPGHRSAASWTSPFKPSYYKVGDSFDRNKPCGESSFRPRDSFRGRGSYRGLSDRYNPKDRDYKGYKENNNFYKGRDTYQWKDTQDRFSKGPDNFSGDQEISNYRGRRFDDLNRPTYKNTSPDNSNSEDWDEQTEEANVSLDTESDVSTPQPYEKTEKRKVTSPACSPDSMSSSSSMEVVTTAKAEKVNKEMSTKLVQAPTKPLHNRLMGLTPAQLRLNAQIKAAQKLQEELALLAEKSEAQSIKDCLNIKMREDMPLNERYYYQLLVDNLPQKGLPEAEFDVSFRLSNTMKLYTCNLKVGILSVTSSPFEDVVEMIVVDYACREMIRALNRVQLPVEVHSLQPQEVQHRILRLIFLHPRGIWNTSLPRLYSVAFKEPIPSNWLELVEAIEKHQVQILVQSQNPGVAILKPNLAGISVLSTEPLKSPVTQQDLPNMRQSQGMSQQTISMPHSVELPVQATQPFMPIFPTNPRFNPLIRAPIIDNPLAPRIPFGPPRMPRGRASRSSIEPLTYVPMFTPQYMPPMQQQTVYPNPPPIQDVPHFNQQDINPLLSQEFFSNSSLPLEQLCTSPSVRSPSMSPQLNVSQVTTHSGSETASSATMSLPTLSPEPQSPELPELGSLENIGLLSNDFATLGINQKLKLPDDDAWDVQVTVANSVTEVWVRIVTDSNMNPFNNMIGDMEIHYMNQHEEPAVPIEPKVGSYYVIQLESCWHRVKLVELALKESDDDVVLFFIDQGDEEKYPFSMCRYLDPRFMTLPGQAVQCHLAFMEMFKKDPLITEHLINLLIGKYFVANILSLRDSKAYVVLYDTENNSDVNVNNLVVEKLAESLKPTYLNEVGSVKEIYLSHITREGIVCIQVLDTAYYCIQYMTYQLTNYPMKQQSKTQMTFKDGQVYVARYNLAEDLLRVLVFSKPDEYKQVVVHYIDYGFKELIPTNRLFRATDFSKAIQNILPLAKNAKLSNLPPSRFTSQMATRLRTLVPNNVPVLAKLLKRPAGDLAEIELFKRIQPDNLLVSVNNTLLLDPHLLNEEKQEKDVGKGENQLPLTPEMRVGVHDERALERMESIKQSFKPLAIPNIGEEFDVHVAMASNPSNFTVQPWSQNQQLDHMMKEMQRVYEDEAHEELTIGDIVAGGVYAVLNSDGHWYRATVSRHMGSFDKAAIFVCFTDFGDFNVVPLERIKLLGDHFKELPVQAIKAKLFGVSPVHADWSLDACLFFQTLVNQREFVSIVMENGPDLLNPSDTVIGLRLIDTSSDKDVHIDKLLVDKGHGVFISKTVK